MPKDKPIYIDPIHVIDGCPELKPTNYTHVSISDSMHIRDGEGSVVELSEFEVVSGELEDK